MKKAWGRIDFHITTNRILQLQKEKLKMDTDLENPLWHRIPDKHFLTIFHIIEAPNKMLE